MKLVNLSAVVFGLVTLAPIAAFAQGAAGTWDVTIDSPQGAQTVQVALTDTAGKLAGTLSSPLGSVDVDGTATGADVVVTAKIDAQGMQIVLTFRGKVAGDAFNGSVQLGDLGEAPFTGTRAAAKAPASAAPASAVAASAAGASSAPGDASGKWDITLSLAGAGDYPMSATFTQAGDKITGTLSSQAGDVPVSGTMTGNALSMKFTAQTPAGEIPVTMTGTLSGATFTGKATIEGLGEADWTGKRAN